MGNVNAIVEGCSALVRGVWEDRGCCRQMEMWKQPLRHLLAPEQGRECRQPFSAAWAAGLRMGEEASFCWLQGRVPRQVSFTFLRHLPGHLYRRSQPCLFSSLPPPWEETPSRLQARAPALPPAHPPAHVTAAHLAASHLAAHLHTQLP